MTEAGAAAAQLVFCTLFDSRYLARGLVMLESLGRAAPGARVYVFAFDEQCRRVLERLGLPGVNVVALGEFEDERLLAVKPGRTGAEYCWTCTPSVILHVLEKRGQRACTYVDADLRFYLTPQALFDELGDGSVLITGHRYSPGYDETLASGKYCVQFLTFKNDAAGLRALRWWREACLDWCYARAEEGKFGDQKYLDDWPERFPGVRVLEHLGGGVAPWNVQQYALSGGPGGLRVGEKRSGGTFPLVFYHFQSIKFFDNATVDLGYYHLGRRVVRLLYAPYVRELLAVQARLQRLEDGDYLATQRALPWFARAPRHIKRVFIGRHNIHSLARLAGA